MFGSSVLCTFVVCVVFGDSFVDIDENINAFIDACIPFAYVLQTAHSYYMILLSCNMFRCIGNMVFLYCCSGVVSRPQCMGCLVIVNRCFIRCTIVRFTTIFIYSSFRQHVLLPSSRCPTDISAIKYGQVATMSTVSGVLCKAMEKHNLLNSD